MFVSEEIVVPAGFTAVRARLTNIIQGDTLRRTSEQAYDDSHVTMLRVGPSPVVSRLVRAEFRELVDHGDSCLLTLRWEATGPAGQLFPVLDADITITPHDDNSVLLRLDGAYRPPLGQVGAQIDRTIMHRAANATIRAFLGGISNALAHPAEQSDAATQQAEHRWSPAPDTP
jgi:hypothetical protein